MLCAVWYHLYNLKIVKSTHGGILFFVKPAMEAETCNFAISNIPPWVFFHVLKIVEMVPNCLLYFIKGIFIELKAILFSSKLLSNIYVQINYVCLSRSENYQWICYHFISLYLYFYKVLQGLKMKQKV